MDLSELQQRRNAWIEKQTGGFDHPHTSIMGATEEMLHELIPLLQVWEAIGRLNRHHIKLEANIRGTKEEHEAQIKDALGDCVVFLAGVATHYGWDFGEVVRECWEQVEQRDWVADPQGGKPEETPPSEDDKLQKSYPELASDNPKPIRVTKDQVDRAME